jgi:alpha-beta hydrolase superfamily lysophospholipase
MDENAENMNTIEWMWKTGDGLEMYAKAWEPAGKARGLVCLLHGVGEHIGRYQAVGEALAMAGYILAGFDQRGFGRSGGRKGHVDSLDVYFDDIDLFLAETAKRFPGIPSFLYGHSMGAILALAYPPLRSPRVSGVVATAPGLKTSLEKQKVKVWLAKVLGSAIPTLTMDNGLDAGMLSRDTDIVDAYLNDPLVHRQVTTGWGKAMLKAIDMSVKSAPRFSHPLLLMHGTRDVIAYPSSITMFASQAPTDRLTMKMWDGMMHEIHQEPGKAEVIAYMVGWLDQHVNGHRALTIVAGPTSLPE